MTISPLPKEKINIPIDEMSAGSSQEACFVVVNEGDGILKLFNVVPSVLLGVVSFLADQILNGLTLLFFDLTLIEESFYFKALQLISIAFQKY